MTDLRIVFLCADCGKSSTGLIHLALTDGGGGITGRMTGWSDFAWGEYDDTDALRCRSCWAASMDRSNRATRRGTPINPQSGATQ